MSANKTIKFFISSTFKDFLKERNALQNFVFPRLKKLCQKEGFGFQPVDLRWGVTPESSDDNQTMNFCLNEVKRCSSEPKPNLLVLLGQRYGWGPLPSEINATDFENDIGNNKLSEEDNKYLRTWYLLDTNSMTHIYYLKDKKNVKNWREDETKLKQILKKAVGHNDKYKDFFKSATELEIRDALDNQFLGNEDNTLVYLRGFSTAADEEYYENSDEKQEKLTKLKNDLKVKKSKVENESFLYSIIEKNSIDLNLYKESDKDTQKFSALSSDLQYFCIKIFQQYYKNIRREMKKYTKDKASDLIIEIEEQKKFLEFKSEVVIGRGNEVKEIKSFILNSDEQYYLLYGKSGSGKSSVMAQTIFDLTDEGSKDKLSDEYKVLYRFIGTTAHTSSPRDTFEHIYWELKGEEKKPFLEHEDHKFYTQFRELLKSYGKQIILFIDAVDQFNTYDSLSIFLDELPENVKVVFSTLNKHKQEDNIDTLYYKRLINSISKTDELDVLKNSNEAILKSWLDKDKRELTEEQSKYLLSQCEKQTPLYLRLAFIIAKEWKSTYTEYKNDIQGDEKELILKFFEKLEENHYHKNNLIERVLGFISASRDGLSESELIDLLSREKDILTNYEREKSSYPTLSKLPDAIFSRLYFHMQEFFTEKLIDDKMLIKPFHRIIAETIEDEYYENNKKKLHENLVNYFKDEINHKRQYKELPWSYYKLDDDSNLSNFLYDPFLIATFYKDYKVDLFFYYNYLSKNKNNETSLDIFFEFFKLTVKTYDESNKNISNEISSRVLHCGMFFQDIGKIEYAKQIFETGVQVPGDEWPSTVIKLISTFIELNQFDEASNQIDSISKISKELPDSNFKQSLLSLKAVILRRQGNYNEAGDIYNELGNNVNIQYNKAVALKQSGELGESKKILEELLSQNQSDIEFRLQVQSSYGSLLRQLRQVPEAYEILEKTYVEATQYFPENNGLYHVVINNYAKVCTEIKDKEYQEKAKELYEELLKLRLSKYSNPNHEEVLLSKHNLSEINLLLGYTKDALLYAKEAYIGREKVFGISHRDTVLSQVAYFSLLITDKDPDIALLSKLFQELFKHGDIIQKYESEYEVFNTALQLYCELYGDLSCNQCGQIFFQISSHLKEKKNFNEAIKYDKKRFNCVKNTITETKNFLGLLFVSTTLATTYYKLDLKEKVIEIEEFIVDSLRANYEYIFDEQKIFDISQFIKSIKNLAESYLDNNKINQSILLQKEALDLRFTKGEQAGSTLMPDEKGEMVVEKNDIYGIFKINFDEYINYINQLITFAYKHDLLDIATELQQEAITKCFERLDENYEKYLELILNYYSSLAAMYLIKDNTEAKLKYEDVLNFIQIQFVKNKISKQVCIEKQISILNGIKLLLSKFIETQREIAIQLNNLLIELYSLLFEYDETGLIDEYMETIRLKIKFLKDEGELDNAIKNELLIGNYLSKYKTSIENWQEKTTLHLNNLATGYYNFDQYKDAKIYANKLHDFFEEFNIIHDKHYENSQNILNLINQKEQENNFLNRFFLIDSNARDEMLKVLFLVEHSLSNQECEELLIKHNFTKDTPFAIYVVNSNEELVFIQQYYNEDIKLPTLVYFFEGDIEFVINIPTMNVNEATFTDLLYLSKVLAYTHKEDKISGDSFVDALGFIELNEHARQIFKQITNLDSLPEYENAEQLIELAKKTPQLIYSENLNGLIKQLKDIFGDESIGTLR